MKSNYGTWNWADFGKGLLTAVGTAVLSAIAIPLTTPPMHFPTPVEWAIVSVAAGSAFVTYMLKQLGTNSSGNLGKKE